MVYPPAIYQLLVANGSILLLNSDVKPPPEEIPTKSK